MTDGSTLMDAESRLERLLRLLQGAIRAAGLTQSEVDGRIGRRRGYLSHVFQRRVDLRLIDLLRTLEVLGLEPGRFFRALFSAREPALRREEDAELRERVRQAVRALLAGRSG